MDTSPGASRRMFLAGAPFAAAIALATKPAKAKKGKKAKKKAKKKPLIGFCVGRAPSVSYTTSPPGRINVTWEVRCLDLRVEPAANTGVAYIGADRSATDGSMQSQMLPTIAEALFGVPASQASRIKLELY